MTNVPGSNNTLTRMDFILFQSRNRVAENNSISKYSMAAEMIQFSLEARTETQQNIGTQDALAQFNRLDEDLKSSLIYKRQTNRRIVSRAG